MGAWIFVVELAARGLPSLGPWAGALVAAGFLGLPLLIAHRRGFPGDPLGIGRAPLLKGALWGLAATAIVAVPFTLGYDQLATRAWAQTRFAGPGLLSPGLAFQGAPPPGRRGVLIYEYGHYVAIRNNTAAPVVIRRGETGGALQPGAVRLQPGRDAPVTLARPDGAALAGDTVKLGAAGSIADSDVLDLRRRRVWLLWLLLTQLVMVALPEEAFFRGWVLGRLRQALPTPQRRVLGVHFGAPHVLSALLFALVHLVITPAPHRLLVFFPGLLFAWLAERTQAVIAPTVHHALSNVLLRVVSRIYR